MQRIPAAELSKNVLRLPRLPIPHVAATADRYRASIPPLRTGETAMQHIARLDTFLESSAGVLQKIIVERDRTAAEAGAYPFAYTEPVMYATALNSRAPLEVNMNASFVLKKGPESSQAGVAATMVHGMATWVRDIQKSGLLVKDPKKDVSPLLTELGRSLIPSKEADAIHTTPLEKLRHVVVLHDGHPYVLNVFDEKQNVLDRALIQRGFELILSITPDNDNTSPVTVLTAGSRAVWGQAYQELIKNPENAQALQCVHDSMLVVCLDSKGWGDDTPLAQKSALHGSKEELENRWYDKHQMIVSADGQVAFNLEPTASQQDHWARWIDDVLGVTRFYDPSPNSVSTDAVDGAKASEIVRRLNITYGKAFAAHIRSARLEAMNLVSDAEVEPLALPFGRRQLAELNISPDAFVQLTLQLARHVLHEKLCATSKLCTTTGFFHGSSEIVRCTTAEAVSLAEAYNGADKASTTSSDHASRIRAAAAKYDLLQAEATRGDGIDRHLMVLRDVAVTNQDKAALAFFEDDLYKHANHYLMNTCECSMPWMRFYACGPGSTNGYGIGYAIDEDEIRLSIAAFTDSPATNTADMVSSIVPTATWIANALKATRS